MWGQWAADLACKETLKCITSHNPPVWGQWAADLACKETLKCITVTVTKTLQTQKQNSKREEHPPCSLIVSLLVSSSHCPKRGTATSSTTGSKLGADHANTQQSHTNKMAAENIYNWIQEEQEAAHKPPMYRSKHNPQAPLPASTFGVKKSANGIGTFGRIVKDTVKPNKYLKGRERCGRGVQPSSKRTSRLQLRSREIKIRTPHYRFAAARTTRPRQKTKPAIPSRSDRPVMGVKHDKDFVTANAVENILAGTSLRVVKCVLSP